MSQTRPRARGLLCKLVVLLPVSMVLANHVCARGGVDLVVLSLLPHSNEIALMLPDCLAAVSRDLAALSEVILVNSVY